MFSNEELDVIKKSLKQYRSNLFKEALHGLSGKSLEEVRTAEGILERIDAVRRHDQ